MIAGSTDRIDRRFLLLGPALVVLCPDSWKCIFKCFLFFPLIRLASLLRKGVNR
jgi:hypothetical protein